MMHAASHHLGSFFLKIKGVHTAYFSIPYAVLPPLLPASLYHVRLCTESSKKAERARLRHANRSSCPLSGRRKLPVLASAYFVCKGSITMPCALASLGSCSVTQESGFKFRDPCNREHNRECWAMAS